MAMRVKKSVQSQSILAPLLVLSLIFFIGFVASLFLLIIPAWMTYKATHWPTTTAIVDSAEIEVKHGDKSVSYAPKVQYHYFVDEQRFESDTFWFRISDYSNKAELEAIMAPYKPNAEVPCYVNPDNAKQSVLIPNAGFGVVAFVIPAAFMGIPAFIALMILLSRKQGNENSIGSKRATASRPLLNANSFAGPNDTQHPMHTLPAESQVFQSQYCRHESDDGFEDQPHLLKSTNNAMAAFIGISLFALFWNGILGLITYSFISQANWRWTPLLFVTPFLLIGVLLLVFVGYSFLQLFNPKPAVVCSNRLLYPGSDFELSWTFSGRSSALRSVKINITGQETVSYRQGTSTRTENHEFFKQEVIHTTERSEIDEGYALVKIPVDTMHSFEAKHNKVKWFAQIVGEISYWPDVEDTYELTIYPPPISNGLS